MQETLLKSRKKIAILVLAFAKVAFALAWEV